jgi:rubrerythrin
MSFWFNADEVFKIAEQIEINGAKFYRSAAENIVEPEKKKLLFHLAEMEDEHIKTFKELHNQLSTNEKELTTFDPDDQSAYYLKALADTRVFYEKTIDNTDLTEILKTAITAEKDSIVFYLGMKDVVPAHLGKDKLDAIIKEEMGHISLLSKELLGIDK